MLQYGVLVCKEKRSQLGVDIYMYILNILPESKGCEFKDLKGANSNSEFCTFANGTRAETLSSEILLIVFVRIVLNEEV